MESLYPALLICILVFVVAKPVFNLFAFVWSFIYFKILQARDRSQHDITQRTARPAKISPKSILSKYATGLIFYALQQTGKITFHAIRNLLYRHVFRVRMKKNVVIYGGAEIRSPHKLSIGKGSIIGHHAILDARNGIEIGENVNFSTGVWIWTEQHNYNSSDFGCESTRDKKTVIRNRVWLGPRVIVLPGCTIGEGAVVGAGAVVVKDIEPFTINVGIPAKKIGERSRNLTYEFEGNPVPFV